MNSEICLSSQVCPEHTLVRGAHKIKPVLTGGKNAEPFPRLLKFHSEQ